MIIRCFDLGGGGLKTALIKYQNGIPKLISKVSQLGKCDDNQHIHKWIREKVIELNIGNIDTEISQNYFFSFSLAGLDKLRSRKVKTIKMYKLFKLPKKKVKQIGDGNAHLLASLKMIKHIPKGRIWNFSIGTGVGMGFTNKRKKIKPEIAIKLFFDTDNPWHVLMPRTKQAVCTSGSAIAFDKILKKQNKSNAITEFAKRWKSFIEDQIIHNENASWGKPDTIIFTGGIIEHHDNKLVKKLKQLNIKVNVLTGPKYAGLYGAGWNIISDYYQKVDKIQLFRNWLEGEFNSSFMPARIIIRRRFESIENIKVANDMKIEKTFKDVRGNYILKGHYDHIQSCEQFKCIKNSLRELASKILVIPEWSKDYRIWNKNSSLDNIVFVQLPNGLLFLLEGNHRVMSWWNSGKKNDEFHFYIISLSSYDAGKEWWQMSECKLLSEVIHK